MACFVTAASNTQSGNIALGYDARGNLTSAPSPASGSNGQGNTSETYAYNPQNMLIGTKNMGINYDAIGRLVLDAATADRKYGYAGSQLLTERKNDGTMMARYVPGPDEAPLLVHDGGSTSSSRHYLVTDERGSVVALTNGQGALQSINTYDEFGIPGSNNTGRFGYTGQAWNSTLGMWYYKARIYSPNLGRFMQTDPIGYQDGLNWYNYVGGDPVNGTDPSGLVEEESFRSYANTKYDKQTTDDGAGGNDIIVTGRRPQGPDVILAQMIAQARAASDKLLAQIPPRPRPKPRKPPKPAELITDPGCKKALSENGTIVYSGGTGTLIVGGGVTGSFGSFTNQTTGTRGSYWSIGGGGGADIGGGAQLGYSRNIRLFTGGSVSGSASGFGFGGSANGALSDQGVTYSGLSGSVAPGPWKFGVSATATGTKIYSCMVASH